MTDRLLRIGVIAIGLAGLAVAGYLTWAHYQPEALVCTAGGGCETVQESDYATLLGVPVALLGALLFGAVVVLAAWDPPWGRVVVAALSVGAAGFAAYLIALQAFVIEAWCIWCLVNDVVVIPLLAVLAVWRVARAG